MGSVDYGDMGRHRPRLLDVGRSVFRLYMPENALKMAEVLGMVMSAHRSEARR